jgi:hypothetical protein
MQETNLTSKPSCDLNNYFARELIPLDFINSFYIVKTLVLNQVSIDLNIHGSTEHAD